MRTAVVTGAARGLGRAMAARLVADGFAVWAVDTDEAEVTSMARETGVTGCALDVTDENAVDGLAARLERCDALVNNAAIWRFTPLAATPIDEASRVLAVNVLGPLLLMQRLVPVMARGGGGTIVNVSSITAKYSPTGTGVYPASKAALEALTRVAAVEFGPLGIRCNAVGPGIIPTEGTLSHYGDEATRQRRGRTLPAGRYGEPGDIADVVAFFCSDDSRYVTGQVVYVDGGYTAAGAEFFRLGRDAGARIRRPGRRALPGRDRRSPGRPGRVHRHAGRYLRRTRAGCSRTRSSPPPRTGSARSIAACSTLSSAMTCRAWPCGAGPRRGRSRPPRRWPGGWRTCSTRARASCSCTTRWPAGPPGRAGPRCSAAATTTRRPRCAAGAGPTRDSGTHGTPRAFARRTIRCARGWMTSS